MRMMHVAMMVTMVMLAFGCTPKTSEPSKTESQPNKPKTEAEPAAPKADPGPPKVEADLIVHNAKVFTHTKGFTQAVAVKDGRFLLVGDDAEILASKGDGTDHTRVASYNPWIALH